MEPKGRTRARPTDWKQSLASDQESHLCFWRYKHFSLSLSLRTEYPGTLAGTWSPHRIMVPCTYRFQIPGGSGAALQPGLGLVGEHNTEPAAGIFLAPSQAFVRFLRFGSLGCWCHSLLCSGSRGQPHSPDLKRQPLPHSLPPNPALFVPSLSYNILHFMFMCLLPVSPARMQTP